MQERDLGSIPVSGRSPGGGNGNPLQYPCLGNLMDRGAWWAIVHGVTRQDLVTKPPPPCRHMLELNFASLASNRSGLGIDQPWDQGLMPDQDWTSQSSFLRNLS